MIEVQRRLKAGEKTVPLQKVIANVGLANGFARTTVFNTVWRVALTRSWRAHTFERKKHCWLLCPN